MEIGELVCNCMGANIQTGFRSLLGQDDPVPYVAVQMTKNGGVYFYDFIRDGTVLKDSQRIKNG